MIAFRSFLVITIVVLLGCEESSEPTNEYTYNGNMDSGVLGTYSVSGSHYDWFWGTTYSGQIQVSVTKPGFDYIVCLSHVKVGEYEAGSISFRSAQSSGDIDYVDQTASKKFIGQVSLSNYTSSGSISEYQVGGSGDGTLLERWEWN